MPTAKARSLHAEAQSLVDALHELQAQHQALVERLREAKTIEDLRGVHSKLDANRGVALELMRQHGDAVDKYVEVLKLALPRQAVVFDGDGR